MSSSDVQLNEDEADYDVERVLDEKMVNGKRHFLLKWIGKRISSKMFHVVLYSSSFRLR